MKKFICCLMLAQFPLLANAQAYQHTDANGHVTLSNLPTAAERQEQQTRKQATVQAAPQPAAAASFPRISAKEQGARDSGRKQVLQDELVSEEARLQAALARNDGERAQRSRADIEALKRELAKTP